MRKRFIIYFLFCCLISASAQDLKHFADSLRIRYKIPELAYAIVSQDSIFEMEVLGHKKINSEMNAAPNDRFRIGSNTKAITGYIAALLVKQKKISWDTKFFDLFPELKGQSKSAYHHLTLLKLLTCRTRLIPWTYTYPEPAADQFKGNENEQRRQFVAWFLKQEPVASQQEYNYSNLGYVAAGLMLEKASGRSYKDLVAQLGKDLDIRFGTGAPNSADSTQPWGHNQHLVPEPPGENNKLNWLLPAGNLNVSLPHYLKFIQLQLLGLSGRSKDLTKKEFEFLHFGSPIFSIGWFWRADDKGKRYSYNTGNPGSFLTKVFIFENSGNAFIFFANAQTSDAESAMNILLTKLQEKYEP